MQKKLLQMMNMKKKPQRYSYKKLLSTTRRQQTKANDDSRELLRDDKQMSLRHKNQIKSSSKNKSAQKILSVYQSSKAKFKIGKFLSTNQRQQRIKTQTDQLHKTKTNYNKINSVRKIPPKQKDQKLIQRQIHTSNKPINQNKLYIQQKNKLFIDNTMSKPSNRTFNKRLNLNSELFQNLNNFQRDKYQVPQTSKNQKKNYSFRKEHDSYRSRNKKTALEKYISESLENLQYPIKKKNSKIINRNQQDQKVSYKINDEKLSGRLNNQRISNRLNQQVQNNKHGGQQSGQRTYLQYSGSKQKKQFYHHQDRNEVPHYRQEKNIFDDDNQIQQSAPQRTIKSPKPHPSQYYQENSHRKLKTQKDDSSVQKIQIKWQKKRKNPYDLSNQETQTFGDRFPDGFDKIKLLGRGGFSLVWLGQHKKSKKKYAVKQIITQSSHQTHIKQIWFGTYFFQFGGAPKQQFSHCPGIKNLVKLYYYFINKKDTWILYQKCGDSLGNSLYQLKGQNYNGQKMYRIHYKPFYQRLKQNQQQIRKIILQVSKALQLLAQNNIVHSDLKTQNILVRLRSQQVSQSQAKTVPAKESGRLFKSSIIQEVKLIDYGSSFVFNNLRQFSMATPEYMAPEILNFILYQNQLEYIPKLFDYVQEYHDPWVIDIWSLGSVILEIISGIPLWMSLKTIVKRKGKQLIRYGLFAVKGRTFDKIIKKQLQVVQNLQKYLQQQNYSDIVIEEDIKYLLKRMLCLNPAKRISPTQIIEFLNKKSMQGKNKG